MKISSFHQCTNPIFLCSWTGLSYMHFGRDSEGLELCITQFLNSKSMTDKLNSLALLVHSPVNCRHAELALEYFYEHYRPHTLLMNKWFRVQATAPLPNLTLDRVKSLTRHEVGPFESRENIQEDNGTLTRYKNMF